MYRLALISLAVFLIAGECYAQVPATAVSDTIRAPADSSFHMTKSPLEAVLLSAVVPGAGQVYLNQAWKLPIIYGLLAGFAYGVYIQNSRYHAAIDSANSELAMAHGPDSLQAYFSSQGWVNAREFYRNDRDKWWIYMGLTYVANVLDAYIAANLYDFDVSTPAGGNVPFRSYYDPLDGQVGISYTIHF